MRRALFGVAGFALGTAVSYAVILLFFPTMNYERALGFILPAMLVGTVLGVWKGGAKKQV